MIKKNETAKKYIIAATGLSKMYDTGSFLKPFFIKKCY